MKLISKQAMAIECSSPYGPPHRTSASVARCVLTHLSIISRQCERCLPVPLRTILIFSNELTRGSLEYGEASARA